MAPEIDNQMDGPDQDVGSEDSAKSLRDRLSEEANKRSALEAQVANLQGQIAHLSKSNEPAPAPEPQVLTEIELENMIEEGKCTRAEANQYSKNVLKQEIDRTIERTVNAKVDAKTKAIQRDQEYETYRQLRPDVFVDGTEDRKKCVVAMSRLVDRGMPNDKDTELLAMNMAIGPVDSLTKKPVRQAGTAEDVVSGGGSPDVSNDTGGFPLDMPQRQREYYKKQIDMGRKTLQQVNKMWKDHGKKVA